MPLAATALAFLCALDGGTWSNSTATWLRFRCANNGLSTLLRVHTTRTVNTRYRLLARNQRNMSSLRFPRTHCLIVLKPFRADFLLARMPASSERLTLSLASACHPHTSTARFLIYNRMFRFIYLTLVFILLFLHSLPFFSPEVSLRFLMLIYIFYAHPFSIITEIFLVLFF